MLTVLLDDLQKGDKLALSRVLSQVEADTDQGRAALEELFPFTGHAHKIGITGPPGAGKSTLVNALTRRLRKLPNSPKVAILAVDPTSPFTGGALLGDRVRMQDLQGDSGIFIRSIATRGALGGLSDATESLSQVFDAAGYDFILIETVGAGQAEVDIVHLAHTTIVVETPGAGDEIQSIKAGILEIADILVVNKADRPGADQSVHYLQNMLEMGQKSQRQATYEHRLELITNCHTGTPTDESENRWTPPVLKTIATETVGIDELVQSILDRAQYLHQSDTWQVKDRMALAQTIEKMMAQELMSQWKSQIPQNEIDLAVAQVVQRESSPRAIVQRLLSYNKISFNLKSSE